MRMSEESVSTSMKEFAYKPKEILPPVSRYSQFFIYFKYKIRNKCCTSKLNNSKLCDELGFIEICSQSYSFELKIRWKPLQSISEASLWS